MSRLRELMDELCPDGVEYVELGKLAEIGTGRSDRKDAVEDGKYPFYVRSQDVLRKDDYEYDEEAILVPGEGGIGQVFHYVNGKYALHQRVYRIHVTSSKVVTMFVKRYMESQFLWFITREAVTATVKSIRKPMIQRFRIPVPPIEVQREVVRILDSFQELDDALTAEIEAREKQFDILLQHKVKALLSNDGRVSKLGEVLVDKGYVRGPFGSALRKADMVPDGVPVYEQQHAIYGHRDFRYFITNEKAAQLLRFHTKPGDIILSCSGTIGRASIINEDDVEGIINQALLILRPAEDLISTRYLYWLLQSQYGQHSILSRTTGSAQPNLANRKEIESIDIPLPSIELQRAFVKQIDTMKSLTVTLHSERDARRKQFEYYRDRLLSFPEKVS